MRSAVGSKWFKGLVCVTLACLAAGSTLAQFAGGDGSREKPWQIVDAGQLDAIRHHLDAHFILMADIDLGGREAGGAFWNEGRGWTPIGWEPLADGTSSYRAFTGSLDGNRRTIHNLYIGRPELNYVGFFALLGGELRDLALANVSIEGNIGVGSFAGYNGGILSQVRASGKLAGKGFTGQLAGFNHGVLEGSPTASLVLQNTQIGIGSTLRYVTVGAGNEFEIGADLSKDYIARLGPGVRFSSNDFIPGGIELTPALPTLTWDTARKLEAVDLRADVLTHVAGQPAQTVLGAIELLPEYANGEFQQDSTSGEVTVSRPDAVSHLLPVRIIQSSNNLEPGTYKMSNGDVLVNTPNRRGVILWPLLVDPDFFAYEVTARGLAYDLTGAGDIRVRMPGGGYFAARPQTALAAPPAVREGLRSNQRADLPGVAEHALVFRAEDGQLLEQALAPRPADWPAFAAALQRIPELRNVTIDADGTIAVVFRGIERKGRMSYRVFAGGIAPGGSAATLALAGDLNQDGVLDYLVSYPNGDQQFLFCYPF